MYQNSTAQDFDQWVALSDEYALLQRTRSGNELSRRNELVRLARDLKKFEVGIAGSSQIFNAYRH